MRDRFYRRNNLCYKLETAENPKLIKESLGVTRLNALALDSNQECDFTNKECNETAAGFSARSSRFLRVSPASIFIMAVGQWLWGCSRE